ncbi:MAG: hypothetical protein LBS09_03700 [Bacteroidales bacterium]|jgi:hypothetical protein|nr:hypothetical protein [Bacteroidales bacterium]
MKKLSVQFAILWLATGISAQQIDIQWIDKVPEITTGVSWGIPFGKGKIKDNFSFTLTNSQNESIPLQSWVLARHGDGSVKWMGFAASLTPDKSSGLKVNVSQAVAAVAEGISVTEDSRSISINNHVATFVFDKSGKSVLKQIKLGNTVVAENGKLLCMLEDRSGNRNVLHYEDFEGEIKKVILEQAGPVRATVKVEGVHKAVNGAREWLPFTVRFYIYDNTEAVKMVHTILFDGDQFKDFIKGLGVSFDVPLREEIQNRHVRFSGADGGVWGEAVQPLIGRGALNANRENMPFLQASGQRVQDKAALTEQGRTTIANLASWDDFTLSQLTSDGFTVRKRTGDESSWVGTAGGTRSSGLAMAGDVSGGLAVSLKNFWQSFPSEIEINNMKSDKATIKVWMWSPKAEAMDLRHYDLVGHTLNAAYEDYQDGLATPYGVARTSEVTLFPCSGLPSRQDVALLAETAQGINQVMATPKYLHDAKSFGVWSLPDTGGATKQWIEEQINRYFEYYKNAVDQHKWYGFWNYGDVMHSYDTGRHSWQYDMGGYAWDNTELSTDLWLWYSFIRTGRADIFRMAQAMTRHTSEVDMYHIGELTGFGSRHNVSHWGCGSKEVRVGQAWWKRFYYYLTTDERVGDIMHEVADADYSILTLDPLRLAQPRDQFPTGQPTRLRWGPDWIACAGNWFTEWERTGNKKYLDKIKTGMDCLAAMPNGLYSGKGPLGYDPATGKITYEGERDWIDHTNHLANLMGGFEVMMEMYPGVEHKKFNNIYLLYAKFYGLPRDDDYRNRPENRKYKEWWGHYSMPRLGAFASHELNDDYLASVAWNELLKVAAGRDGKVRNLVEVRKVTTPDVLNDVDESAGVSTNSTAQWNLNAIIMLELIGNKVPDLETVVKNNPPQLPAGARQQQQNAPQEPHRDVRRNP